MDNILLIDGGANTPLAQAIAKQLKVDLQTDVVSKFIDGETGIVLDAQVRGRNAFIIQPTSDPANETLMNLMILTDALRRASAAHVTAVVPYFGYARQDRKDQPRRPVTAKLVANLLSAAGVDRVVTIDLHAHQIQGFFDIRLDHLYARNILMDEVKKLCDNAVIVAPDVGAAKMAEGYAERIGVDMAILHKKRIDDSNTEVSGIVGDVSGKDAVIVDDIVSTAGSLCSAATALRVGGAKKIYCAISHGVLSGPAIERLEKSDIDQVLITDSIALPEDKQIDKVKVVSLAPLLAEAIDRINTNRSISDLFRT